MKAITQEKYGASDVLSLNDVERPVPGEGEVLLEVRAAGCGPDVWHVTNGLPLFARPMLGGLRAPKPATPGRDVAGIVVEVGPGVTKVAVGDEVYGTCRTGSFAEYAVAPEATLAPKPVALSWPEAAAVPISGGTALQGLQAAKVGPGSRVMVIGAGGGVGSFAVQIAVALGATVTAVCSAAKADLARELGASDVLDYATQEVDRDGPVYDVIIDTAGNRRLSLLRRALTPTGVLVLVGGDQHGGRIMGGFQRQLLAGVRSIGAKQKMIGLIAKEQRSTLLELRALIDAGEVTPRVGRTYSLTDAPQAVHDVGTAHSTGKLVVTL
jgi:NADPH:quinone reductase-like Zn-dependent oxidoreductase